MNVEQAYIKYHDPERIAEIVKQRLNGKLSDIAFDKKLSILDSYAPVLAGNPKRKTALSVPENGWITLIESKEVNDNALLLYISKELHTDVLAIIQSDTAGAWGFAEMSDGQVISSYFSEDDDGIEDRIISKLAEHSIRGPLYMFREVIKDAGFRIIQP